MLELPKAALTSIVFAEPGSTPRPIPELPAHELGPGLANPDRKQGLRPKRNERALRLFRMRLFDSWFPG